MERVAKLESRIYKLRYNRTISMTSLFLGCFKIVLDVYCVPAKLYCCQTPNGRVNLGGGDFAPPSRPIQGAPRPVQNRIIPKHAGGGRNSPTGWVFPLLCCNGKQWEAETL